MLVMSAEAHASFLVDLEAKKYGDGLKRLEDTTKGTMARMTADMDSTRRATERMTTSLARTQQSLYGIGQASLQIQDVAVQLESGASAARVLAQQGSQMASIFGPTGMIVGGVIAIGAGIYSWVSGMKEANEEAKRLMTNLGELQKAGIAKRDTAMENNRTADRMNMSGRTEIEEIRQKFGDERKKMEDEFYGTRADKRDWRLHDVAMAALDKRQKAEEDAVYTKRAEEFEKKEAAAADKAAKDEKERVSDLHKFEKQQYDEFQKYREGKLREFEKMQEAEVKRVTDFQKKEADRNEKLESLQGQLQKEEAKARIDKSAARGQSILDDISNRRNGVSAADVRKSAVREANELRRAEDRILAREGIGKGLSGRERDEARERRRGEIAKDINIAKNKDKLKAEIDGDSINKLTAAIEKLFPE